MIDETAAFEHDADRRRDSADVNAGRAVAAAIVARHGGDLGRMRRGSGWSNLTWVGGGLAIRVAATAAGEEDDLIREARLLPTLAPASVPVVLDAGCTDGRAWMLSVELPGGSLEAAWPSLSSGQQRVAIGQHWRLVSEIHGAEAVARAQARATSPFVAADRAGAAAKLARVVSAGSLDGQQAHRADEVFDLLFDHLASAAQVLCHGDVGASNALWDGTRVNAVLDLEFAIVAPLELDLEPLISEALHPETDAPSPPPPAHLVDAAIEVAVDAGADPVLLLGLAVDRTAWAVGRWLTHLNGEEPIDDWHPVRALRSLLEPDGGYLAPVLDALGR